MATRLLGKLRIPPRRAKKLRGNFDISSPLTVMAASRSAVGPLADFPQCERVLLSRKIGNTRVLIKPENAGSDDDILWPTPPGRAEGFSIRCDSRAIAIFADDEAGLRWAVSTLAEIFELADRQLPAFTLSDWPELEIRGVMVDLSRSCVEKPAYIRRLIDLLAGYRCNMLQLYFEERLDLRKHPLLKHPLGYSLRQVSELARYAARRGISLVPAMATFGHCQGFLQVPQYRHLADGDQIYQLDPLNPQAGKLLGDMFDDWSSVAQGGYVNACCDEAPYFGNNQQTKAYIDTHDVEAFIAMHLSNIHEMLKQRGFRMMIWADMLKKYPAVLSLIPKDIILIEWNYDSIGEATVKAIELFHKKGFEVVAAPAASRSGQIAAPRAGQITDNIPNLVALANRMNLKGILCCQWECLTRSPELSEPGYALACQMAWRGSKSFNTSIRKKIYGDLTGLDGTQADALMKKLSPDRMLKRFKRIQGDRQQAKSYHLTTHELISGDPLIYMRPGGISPWSRALGRQYEDAAEMLRSVRQANGKWNEILKFAVDCGLFAAWKRTKINEAASLFKAANRMYSGGDSEGARSQLAASKKPLEEFAALAEGLNAIAKKVWTMARYDNDPTFAMAYGNRFAVAAQSCRQLLDEIDKCTESICRSGPFTLSDYIAARRVIVLKSFLRDTGEVNILNLDIYLPVSRSESGNWQFGKSDRRVQAFQPPSSRYDYMFMPQKQLPRAIKVELTRTQAPWSLGHDLEIGIYRPPVPGEGVRRFKDVDNINTEEYFLTPVDSERYVISGISGDEAIFVLERD